MSRARVRPSRALAPIVLAFVVLAVAPVAPAESTLERVKRTDRIDVAVANEKPYGYVDEDGRLTGEAPTIAREVLRRIDPEIRMEGHAMDWGKLIPSVQNGDVDVVAAGMFITPERCEQVAFTNPTYVVGEAFLVRAGNPKDVDNYHTISRSHDTKVGLIAGTVEYNYAMHAGIPADRALLYADFKKAVDALQRGEVDAVGLTSLTARSLARRMEDAEVEATKQFYPVVRGEITKGYGGFAFRKEDDEIVAAFNRELDDFIGTDEHWTMVEAFGFAPDMAPDKTAAELCAGG